MIGNIVRLWPLALVFRLMPACGEEPCDLRASMPNIALQDARGNLVPQATIAVTWTGEDKHVVEFEFSCGLPATPESGDADTCSFTVDYGREPGRYGAGTLALRIDAPGLVPLEKEYSRTVNGCEVEPQINEFLTLADESDVSALCTSMCMVDVQCDLDSGWTAEECTSACEGDLELAGDAAADRCRPAFAALHACTGELSCAEYLAFLAGEPNPCSAVEEQVATCEEQSPSQGVEPSP
ncbi:hypothetical protein OV090_37590 [Nannocystis sp. RBIL2]|uniref:hypothetical protein n=1 Tax=Nannocystis sp. RBIL2 TaxID=2996788 RepID=UPI0022709FB2|nr:hypothetical protein [Nannocystis sp. RBIL2]MCY1070516.1 hypothetical protein [Nannocystis sp. RBIL2]